MRFTYSIYIFMSSKCVSQNRVCVCVCQMGQFYYAAKAFDVLERLDHQNPEYWEGKRGACVGIFQLILAGREPRYHTILHHCDIYLT